MFLNEANMQAVLDRVASRGSLGPSMAAIGASEKLFFVWAGRSANSDPKLLVRWPLADDGELPEPIQFAQAVKLAQKMSRADYIGQLEDEVRHGVPVDVIVDGKRIYEVDESLDGYTDEELQTLLGLPDRYLRKDGRKVRMVRYETAPAHLKIKAAAALSPTIWGDHKTVDLNVTGGVVTMKAPEISTDQRVADLELQIIELKALLTTRALPAPDAEYTVNPRLVDNPADRPDIRALKALARRQEMQKAGVQLPDDAIVGYDADDDKPEHIGRDPNGPRADTGERSQGIPYNDGRARAGGRDSEFLGAPVTSRNGERAVRTVGGPENEIPLGGVNRNRVSGV